MTKSDEIITYRGEEIFRVQEGKPLMTTEVTRERLAEILLDLKRALDEAQGRGLEYLRRFGS